MTDPLRTNHARAFGGDEDRGDVLSSIRRLIAQDDGPSGAETAPAEGRGTAHPHPAAGMPAPASPSQGGVGAEQPRPLRLERPAAAESAGLVAFPSFGAAPARPACPASGSPLMLTPDSGVAAARGGPPPLSPAGTAELTASLAEAVGAAAARMAGTARPVTHEDHAMHDDPAEPPFRLRPDALIPAAPAAAPQAGPAQPLWPQPLPAQPLSPVWGDARAEAAGDNPSEPAPPLTPASAWRRDAGAVAESAPSVAGPVPAALSAWSTDRADALPGPVGAAAAGRAPSAAAGVLAAGGVVGASDGYAQAVPGLPARSDAAIGGVPAPAERAALWPGRADTQSTGTQPVGTQPVGTPARSAAAPGAASPAPTAGTQHDRTALSLATAPDTPPEISMADPMEHRMNAQPIRDLLREAIREELRGEIGRQLDTDLRRLVREELAVALTEALTLPA